MSYTLATGSFPVPLGPTPTTIGTGSSGAFSTGMVAGVSNSLNQLASASLFGIAAGGGYGIVTGLSLSSPSGLNVLLSTGAAMLDAPLEIVSSGAYGAYQANAPVTLTLPVSSTSFVWMTATGTLTSNTNATVVPSGGKLFLGTVTTSASAVTSIDYSGVVYVVNGDRIRFTADSWAPNDAPEVTVRLATQTASGMYRWDGVSHKQQVDPSHQFITPYKAVSLVADYVVSVNDPNLLSLNPGGTTRNVTLPDPTMITIGHSFTVANPTGSTGNLVLKNHAGTTLTTITPGNQAYAGPAVDHTGAQSWPTPTTPVGIGLMPV